VDLAGTGLPLVPFLPRIDEALEQNRLCVLTAEPGAGKSTLVPAYLLDRRWLEGRKIRMLEPRRLAAAAVAARISELLGEPLGRRAGYRVRSAARVGPETRLEVITEALLSRALEADPLLADTGLVILDEFHERSIHADLALALLLETRRARPDLALLLMSATLDADRVAAFISADDSTGPAAVIECPGRVFPVQTEYRPLSSSDRWEREFADLVAGLLPDAGGDVLAFLPGVREIERVAMRLPAGPAGVEAYPLHGSLPLERQQAVLRPRGPGAGRRVVLATSIAETSLTVPGITLVVDAGWARTAELHHATGLERLVTARVSSSSADQRRGRAGRLGPGRCVRAWKENEPLPDRPAPEILRADLSGLVLECALWGAREAGGLRWLDPPPPASWAAARELDRMLGLLDDDGRPTEPGRAAAELGLAPRLAVLVLEGVRSGAVSAAAEAAALLEERDGSGLGRNPDFAARIERLHAGGGSPAWRRAVHEETRRILSRVDAQSRGPPRPAGGRAIGDRDLGGRTLDGRSLAALLGRAFPDRIARRERDGTFRFVTGRAARYPGDARGPEWLVAPDADAGETTGTIRCAAELDAADADRLLAPLVEESVIVRWNGLVPKGVRVKAAGRLVLAEKPWRGEGFPEAAAVSLLDRLRREGIGILPWDDRTRSLLARIRFLAAHAGAAGGHAPREIGGPSALDDAELVRSAPAWLAPRLDFSAGPALDGAGLLRALGALIPGRRADLDRFVPESIVLPTGTRRPVDYSTGVPVTEARIQEVFGMRSGPVICGVPLVFRLLSPAMRPLQVTDDLAGFWRSSYAEVRSEMRGRYPRHHWTEDPSTASPTRSPRRRRS
jgi:ATP-dependent helicase HrpB